MRCRIYLTKTCDQCNLCGKIGNRPSGTIGANRIIKGMTINSEF